MLVGWNAGGRRLFRRLHLKICRRSLHEVEVTDGKVLGVWETEGGTLGPLWANQKPLPVQRWGREPSSCTG